MANLPESPNWRSGIYQLEVTDPVIGGTPNEGTGAGMSNIPAKQLADRTAFLKQESDKAWDSDNCEADLSTAGYQVFASGLMIQWGDGNLVASDSDGTLISFPEEFPNACFQVILSDRAFEPDLSLMQVVSVIDPSISQTGFRAIAASFGGSPSRATTVIKYFAIGH